MSTTLHEAVSHLKAIQDLITPEEADRDATLAGILSASRMALECIVRTPGAMPVLASWGEPSKRSQKWMLHFEDTEVRTMVFDASIYGEAEAELLARDAYRTAQRSWNCTLLKVASLDPLEDDAQRRRADALEASLREMQAVVLRTSPSHADDIEMRLRADLALGEIVESDLRIERVMASIRPENDGELREKRRQLDRLLDLVRTRKRMDERDPAEDDAETRRRETRDLADVLARTRLEKRIARLERVEKAAKEDPSSLLLPLGSLVRVAEFDLDDTRDVQWPLPLSGSLGVVSGYSAGNGRTNIVSFVEDMVDTHGEDRRFDGEDPHRMNYLPDELVVVSHGRLHDGMPVDIPGWWPTHGHGSEGHILYSESMVVSNGGYRWRIEPCSGPPECTQMTTDDAAGDLEFRHLVPLTGGTGVQDRRA
jgi:hypothetical protein